MSGPLIVAVMLAGFGAGCGLVWSFRHRIEAWALRRRYKDPSSGR